MVSPEADRGGPIPDLACSGMSAQRPGEVVLRPRLSTIQQEPPMVSRRGAQECSGDAVQTQDGCALCFVTDPES